MDSILTSVKLLLGIPEDYEQFDMQIMMHINSVFMVLSQLGIGPEQPFSILDKSTTWSDFDTQGHSLEAIKTYMYLKVKAYFDPPSNSFTMDALDKQAKELEWRMMVISDPPFEEVLENEKEDGEEENQNGF